jgi:hypothetical protein
MQVSDELLAKCDDWNTYKLSRKCLSLQKSYAKHTNLISSCSESEIQI